MMEMDEEDIFEDDMDLLEIIYFRFPRQIYARKHYFDELDNLTFFRRFRLYKETVLHLLGQIEDQLEFPSDINNSISPINQLLTCLRFYASAGHLNTVADYMGISIPSVSRIVVRVSETIASLHSDYIKMPGPVDVIREQNKFYRIARFPRVIGLVDGTHVKIQSPGNEDGEVFRNRKSYFSINIQAMCNADLKLINLVARWPGSAHDSTVFNNSHVRAQFEAGLYPNCFILGDNGYPLRNYFLTPLGNPVTPAQQLYNQSHIRTRNGIERMFGIWKRRFPVLAYGMRIKLDTVLRVIIATGVLHNLAMMMNEPQPPPPENLNEEELNYLVEMGQIDDALNENPIRNNNYNPIDARMNVVNNYF